MFRKKICLILMSLLLFFSCKQGIDDTGLNQAENFESFNKVGFGKDGKIDSSFVKSGSPSPVMKSNVEDADEDGYAVYFDFKYLKNGESSLKRTIYIE